MKLTVEDTATQLVEKGIYESYKRAEKYLKMIKEQFRNRLHSHESRRIEFLDYGLVAKFVPKRKFQTDQLSLNQYLYNVGLLPAVVQIKTIKETPELVRELKPFQLKEEFYIRPNFKLESKINKTLPWSTPLEQQSIDELAFWFNKFYRIYKKNKGLYDIAKHKILSTLTLNKIERIEFEYGSLSLVRRQPIYDCYRIFNELGADFLIKHGNISSEKIQNYILKGLLAEADINQYRTVTDINLTFYLLPIEVERQMLERFQANLITASMNRSRF